LFLVSIHAGRLRVMVWRIKPGFANYRLLAEWGDLARSGMVASKRISSLMAVPPELPNCETALRGPHSVERSR
jgi:hypothetical protein